MKKLNLDLDALRVETFDPSPRGRAQRGTVRGHASDWDCPSGLNEKEYPTFNNSCVFGTCGDSCATCDYTCDSVECTIGGGTVTATATYDHSCGGTCNGGVTCFQSVCIEV